MAGAYNDDESNAFALQDGTNVLASADPPCGDELMDDFLPVGKRSRYTCCRHKILLKTALHPQVTLVEASADEVASGLAEVETSDGLWKIAMFVCPSCNQDRCIDALKTKHKEILLRRVRDGLLDDNRRRGAKGIQCRWCVTKAQDDMPKSSVLSAICRGAVTGHLFVRLELEALPRGDKPAREFTFERDLPLRNNQVTLRNEEHVLFEEAWTAIKDHCGRDVLSEDEAI